MLGKRGLEIPARLALLVLAGGLLSACSNPWTGAAATLQEVLAKGWLNDEGEVSEVSDAITAANPIYCYETIGRSDCHDVPLPEPGNRLVGFQGAPPDAFMNP